jgi:CRISPR-associated protein Cas1
MATAPNPLSILRERTLPDYLPARRVNEFVYCPRLFFYEWIDGVFAESADTIEGSSQHKRVDREGKGLPKPEDLGDESIHTRSITLSDEQLRVTAKLDLLEAGNGCVVPVDYKHGKPRQEDGALAMWAPDRVQLGVQALVLRANGYQAAEGVVYYQSTKQRVRVPFDDALLEETRAAIRDAWALARTGVRPAPLDGSPKCAGCSLAPVCLPDEVSLLETAGEPAGAQLLLFAAGEAGPPKKPVRSEVRRLVTPRDERRPLYLNTQGLRVGRSGAVLQVKDRDKVLDEIRMNDLCQVNLLGNIQITTQTIQSLCEADIPVCYFSMGGWFYGLTTGLCTKNVFLRQNQYKMAEEPWFCRKLAASLTEAKIRNQRTFLLRNHIEPDPRLIAQMKLLAERAGHAASLGELLGVEGTAARLYFASFQGFIKAEPGESVPPIFRFDFNGRNRRPPRDAVNALLSLGYSLLVKDFTIACYTVGFDPMMGYYHQPRFGRPALALDLMEPFRPLIVDSAVVSAINNRMITPQDFLSVGETVALSASGRKAFYRAYELRMDTLVSHPLFDYRVSYRRLLEIQARLLAKLLQGEIPTYPAFVTR